MVFYLRFTDGKPADRETVREALRKALQPTYELLPAEYETREDQRRPDALVLGRVKLTVVYDIMYRAEKRTREETPVARMMNVDAIHGSVRFTQPDDTGIGVVPVHEMYFHPTGTNLHFMLCTGRELKKHLPGLESLTVGYMPEPDHEFFLIQP